MSVAGSVYVACFSTYSRYIASMSAWCSCQGACSPFPVYMNTCPSRLDDPNNNYQVRVGVEIGTGTEVVPGKVLKWLRALGP